MQDATNMNEPKSKKRQKQLSISFSDEDEPAEMMIQIDNSSDLSIDLDSEVEMPVCSKTLDKDPNFNQRDLKIENFVIVLFNRDKYPGKIVRLSENGPEVDCMERKLKYWRWPQKKRYNITYMIGWMS